MIHINDIFLMVIFRTFQGHKPWNCAGKWTPPGLPFMSITPLCESYVIFYTHSTWDMSTYAIWVLRVLPLLLVSNLWGHSMCVCLLCVFSHSVMSEWLRCYGLQTTGLLHPWVFLREYTGVGCHFVFKETFQTRDRTLISCISCIAGGLFTSEPLGKPNMCYICYLLVSMLFHSMFFLTWFLLKSVSIEFVQDIIYDPEIIRKIKQIMI